MNSLVVKSLTPLTISNAGNASKAIARLVNNAYRPINNL